jgi:predicted enzyme related to lactoylglutathione lyase
MISDSKSIDRFAQSLFIQYKKGVGSPPQYGTEWQELYDAKIESITDNINATPSELVFWMPTKRWHDETVLGFGDKVRVTYLPEPQPDPDTGITPSGSIPKVLFIGFITKIPRQFSGGNQSGGKYERLAFVALDSRWLLNVLSPCYGQIGRSQDDYTNFGKYTGEDTQTPIVGSFADFSGRRCVFNPKSGKSTKPNCDKEDIVFEDGTSMPCFTNPDNTKAAPWTAYKMVRYILGRITNMAFDYFLIPDPAALPGMPTAEQLKDNKSDWNRVLNNISIEGLNTATALQFICKQIGWSFRIDYDTDEPQIVFFKAGSAGDGPRFVPPAGEEESRPVTLLQTLFAPAPLDSEVGDDAKNIKKAVEAGKIPLWAAQFEPDITNVINAPIYFGSPHRVEFTAELVPAWLDSDLIPDIENLFFEESELSGLENLNQYSFFKYYHARGSQFKRDVGRIWALNESGRYSATPYDRGLPFDLVAVIPPIMSIGEDGRRLFGPFDRELLPCLTKEKLTDNSVGIVVEFSFDGGTTWQKVPAAIISLDGQYGIYITEMNLAEIKPLTDEYIVGGVLNGTDLNYWTSICNDKLTERVFKEAQWKTRVRITASIQLDQRLGGNLAPTNSGSPFPQTDIWDKSGDYHNFSRDVTSIFSASNLPAEVRDDYNEFTKNIKQLRDTMQDTSVSGQFTLERLWLGDIRLGDCVTKIEGREFVMRTDVGEQISYPEIVQIIYLPQKQKMKLITRDLKFSEAK